MYVRRNEKETYTTMSNGVCAPSDAGVASTMRSFEHEDLIVSGSPIMIERARGVGGGRDFSRGSRNREHPPELLALVRRFHGGLRSSRPGTTCRLTISPSETNVFRRYPVAAYIFALPHSTSLHSSAETRISQCCYYRSLLLFFFFLSI